MHFSRTVFALSLAGASLSAVAADHPAASGPAWTGSGELGINAASGNSRSQNINAQLKVGLDDGRWHHAASALWLRNRGEVLVDRDWDGTAEEIMEDTANRYGLAVSSAYDLTPRSYLVGSLRYDHDDFASYLWRGTAAVGYGYRWLDDDRFKLVTEVGPGFRRSRDAYTGAIENEAIGRGLVDFSWRLTDNTRLLDTLLVESGRLNTYIQNDLGLQVGMSDRLALKLGYQVRYNTDVDPGFRKTDTVTMLNLVYAVE